MTYLPAAGLACAFAIATTFAASATTVAFDFASSPANTPSYQTGTSLSFSKDDVDLDVSAHGYYTPNDVNEALETYSNINVTRQDSYGLYVSQGWRDDHRIDGWWNEVVKFDFNDTDVSIKKIRFGSFNHGSDFDLFVGVGGELFYEGSNEVAKGVKLDTATSTIFAIGASDDWSAFKIKKLVVHVVEDDQNEPEPVPLPAGGALLLGAVGVMAARKKFTRKA